MSRRTERVNDLLLRELNQLLLRELRDPRVKLATVSRVEVSGDLQHARVGISALGSEEKRHGCVEALRGARGFLRSRLASRLRLRVVPELVFDLDRGAEHSLRIAHLLEDVDGNDAT